jgi:hypothetical protein
MDDGREENPVNLDPRMAKLAGSKSCPKQPSQLNPVGVEPIVRKETEK